MDFGTKDREWANELQMEEPNLTEKAPWYVLAKTFSTD